VARQIELGDLTLAYQEVDGAGPAVVFVHGLGGSVAAWRAQLVACARDGRGAMAYDQRGAGDSSKPAGPYSVELWAQDLERLLDALALERVALVGHSVGTMVAAHAALRLGERCVALVLLGGALAWPDESRPVFEARAELARAGRMDEIAEQVAATGLSERCRAERPDVHDRFLAMIAANDPEGYAESALATMRGRMVDPERIGCPTLCAAGELDPVTPPGAARQMAAAIPGAECAVVAGAAHWCQIESPEAVNELLLAFLDR
jgi:3-oxoadipate enol-lactonase